MTTLTTLDSYRLLGRSGLRVSPLCLGTMTFGTEWGWGAQYEASKQIFDLYVSRGGNFIDTANYYTKGTSETWLGDFIATDRARLVVATKYTLHMRPGDPNSGGNHRKNMMESVEASLRRLKTDYIDLYWIHMWDYTTPIEEVLRAFDDLVRQGKILYAGVSDTPAWKIAQANTIAKLRGWTPFIAAQMEYSLVQRDLERDILPMSRELGLGNCPWSPLGSGVLAGKYTREDLKQQEAGEKPTHGGEARGARLSPKKLDVAEVVVAIAKEIAKSPSQVALNWLMQQPGVTSPILGARKVEQLEDNLGCLDFELEEEQMTRLNEVSKIELGFPHDFLFGEPVKNHVFGGAKVERRVP